MCYLARVQHALNHVISAVPTGFQFSLDLELCRSFTIETFVLMTATMPFLCQCVQDFLSVVASLSYLGIVECNMCGRNLFLNTH